MTMVRCVQTLQNIRSQGPSRGLIADLVLPRLQALPLLPPSPRLRAPRLALAFTLALFGLAAAPFIDSHRGATSIFAALADDDDGDDGGGGGGGGLGGRGSGEGGGRDAWRGRNRTASNCFLWSCPRPERRAQRQAPRPAPPREFVILRATPDARAAIEAARFRVVADGPLTALPGRVLRVRAPQGMGDRTARRRLAQAAPGAIIDSNDRYRSFLRTSGDAARSRAASLPPRPLAPAVSCAAGSTIALIDTAVDVAHPSLAGARISQLAMRAGDRTPSSPRHGTAVASALVGQPGSTTPGLAPTAGLVVVDAFHRDRAGQDVTDAFDLVRALDLMSGQAADVINLSLAGPDNDALAAMVATLVERGSTIVAAAGNDGPAAKPLYPAAYPGVIAVAAVDGEGRPWRRSARGPHIAFTAEGVNLALAGRNGQPESYTGTSFAAPVVAAMIAAKRASAKAADAPTAAQRLAALAKDRGDPGRDPLYGHGIVEPADACRSS
jgi:hypothetical protein